MTEPARRLRDQRKTIGRPDVDRGMGLRGTGLLHRLLKGARDGVALGGPAYRAYGFDVRRVKLVDQTSRSVPLPFVTR